MIRQGMFGLFATLVLLGAAGTAAAQTAVDAALPPYVRSKEMLKGTITLVGSDTMSTVAAIWADNFRRMYPDVQITIQVKGAVNAVPAVMSGEATFGLLSRTVTMEEVAAFEQQFGYPPHVLTPCLEPIGIFVHKDNPIESLTLAQVDAIFSTSLKRGMPKPIRVWGDLGATGDWARQPIVAHGRSATTGSQVYFQAVVMGNGPFREDLVANQSNRELVRSIAADRRAIGFAGTAFEIPEIKNVAISFADGAPALDVMTPGYPLVRQLQLVVNRKPGTKLPAVQNEFLKYVFSRSGQEDVIIGGFQSIPAAPAHIAIESIGLSTLN